MLHYTNIYFIYKLLSLINIINYYISRVISYNRHFPPRFTYLFWYNYYTNMYYPSVGFRLIWFMVSGNFYLTLYSICTTLLPSFIFFRMFSRDEILWVYTHDLWLWRTIVQNIVLCHTKFGPFESWVCFLIINKY